METQQKVMAGCGGCLALIGAGLALVFGGIGVAAVMANHTVVDTSEVDTTYTGTVRGLDGRLSGEGAVVFAGRVQEGCTASINPFAVVFHQIYYNAITDYELRIWVEPAEHGYGGQYALYQSSGSAVYRKEARDYGAWVLSCDFDPDELRVQLAQHMVRD